MKKQFSAAQFAIDAGWDFSCIEATAAKGVSEVDVETIEAMGFGADEVEQLAAYCVAAQQEGGR